ncbi:(ABC) transporter [Perkinsus chesapeaki]|uniref:(ABC) transporter n=1 Tax=Perkinsus chesapeaki TaxID=330153 RepID=A0A7J6M6P9_PERCH|nr:(ABC) transporter [Perkinsus chesapeaki]
MSSQVSPIRDTSETNEQQQTASKEKQKAPLVPLLSLFRFTSFTEKLLLGLAILCSIGHGIAMPLFAFVFGDIVDTVGDPNDPDIMDVIVKQSLWMGYIGIGTTVVGGIWHGILTYLAASQANKMRVAYLEAVLSSDIRYFDEISPAELPTRMTEDVAKVQDAIGFKIGMCLMNLSMFVFGFGFGFYRGWKITLVMLAAMPVIIATSALLGIVMARGVVETQSWYARAGAVAEEVLSSIRTVTMFGTQQRENDRYRDCLTEAKKGGIKAGMQNGFGVGLAFCSMYCTYALTFWYGGTLVEDGETNDYTGNPYNGGDVLAVFFSVIMATFGLGQAMPPIQTFQAGRASAYAIHKLIDDNTAKIETRMKPSGGSSASVTHDEQLKLESLALDSVTFSYPTRPEVTVLKEVSLIIKPGTKVAIVGESGSGKSTVISLLERFYDPTSGRVLVNGEDVKDLPGGALALRKLFGYVGQEPVLFAASVRDNLTYGLDYTPTDEEIKSACKRANVHSFISSLPDGYNTYCGSSSGGGSQISGGQKQRVAIARALLRNPQILLLDEATSALDNESEKLVQGTLDELQDSTNLTTISIAHRLSTVRNSDVIFVMHEGRLVEQGKHEELINRPAGVYRSLVSSQEAAASMSSPTTEGRETEKAPSTPSESEVDAEITVAVEPYESEEAKEKKRIAAVAKAYKVPWRRLFAINKPECGYFIPAMIGSAMFGTVMPMEGFLLARAMKAFYDPDPTKLMEGVQWAAIGYTLVAFGALFGAALQFSYFAVIGENLTMRIRQLIFAKFLKQDIAYFDDPDHSTGKLTSSLSSYALKMNSITGIQLGVFCQFAASIISGLIIAFSADVKLSLVMMACLPAMAGAGAIQMAVMMGVDNASEKGGARQAAQLASEAIQNMKTVRALIAEQATRDTYQELLSKSFGAQKKASSISGFWFGASNGLMFGGMALGFWYGGKLIIEEGLPFDKMIQSLMGVFLCAMAAGQSMAFLGDVDAAKAAAHDVFELLDSEVSITSAPSTKSNNGFNEGVRIKFDGVSFSYPHRKGVKVLDGLTFEVEPGQTVALVGPSGGGKSTVFALLQRFYDPNEGQVYVGSSGTKLTETELDKWRGTIGFVSQEPVLFDLSLEENVRYGAPPVSTDELHEVCSRAGMDDFAGTKVAWNAQLGPRGGLLSGGQKQRVAIARALIRHPKLVMLDEATSALDSASEAIVQKAIDNFVTARSDANDKPTTLIIAHRLSTVQNADKILVLSETSSRPATSPTNKKKKIVSYFKLFRFATGPQLGAVIVAVLAAALHGLAMPMFAYIFGDLVDVLGNPQGTEFMDEISKRCLYLVYVGLGALVMAGIWHGLLTFTAQRQATTMRRAYFEAVLSHDVAWFDTISPAELPTRMTEDVAKVQNAIGFKLGVFTMNFSMFIFGYVLGFIRGWKVCLVAIAAMPVVIAASAILGHAMAQSANESQTWYARAGAVAEEVLSSIRTVTMMGTQKREVERYGKSLEEARKGGTRLGCQAGLGLGLTFGAIYGSYALTFWYGGTLVRDGVFNDFTDKPYNGGDVLTIFFSLIMGTFGLGQALAPMQAFHIGRSSATDIQALIDDKSSVVEPPMPPRSSDGSLVMPYSIPKMQTMTLKNVCFTYPSRPDVQVLKNVSLQIEIGKKVAFVGESGSGKSTIVGLLERFYDPTTGTVLLNGEDIRELDGSPQCIRSIFGYVGQEPILFAASIKENLSYGLPYTPTDEEIKSACKRANVHSFISSLPDGYNTYCGSSSGGGSQISGGQKQRVAIARALLRNPQILLLDEATSALDNESELMVQETIDSLQRSSQLTTISIAHRLSTIRNSDVIFVMQSGCLMEQGSHDELIANPKGVYSTLVAAQHAAATKGNNRSARPSLVRQDSNASSSAASQSNGETAMVVDTRTEKEVERERIEKIAKSYKVPWRRLLALSKPEFGFYVPALLGAVIFGCVMPFEGFLLSRSMRAFYKTDPDEMMDGVTLASIGYVILGVACLASAFVQMGGFAYIGEHLTKRVRSLCFTKFLEQDMAFFDDPKHSPGRLTAALGTYALKMNAISGVQLGAYVQLTASLIAGLTIAFFGTWKLTLVMIAVLPLMAAAGGIQMAVLLGMDKNKSADSLAANQVASDAVQNIRTIRALVSEQWTRNLFQDLLKRAVPQQARTSSWAALWYGISQGILFFSVALGFWYGSKLVQDEGLTFDKMIQSLMGVFLAGLAAGQALAFVGDISEAKAAAHDVFELLDSESSINPSSESGRRYSVWGPQGTSAPAAVNIKFKDVEFSYPHRPGAKILCGLSFEIEAGKTVALVGPSGGGKSTVFALLQRFYDPTSGEILVEPAQARLDDMNVAWWREQIGFVSQEPVLFDLTLEENVRYGAPPIERPEMLSICARAGMNDFAGSKVAWDVGLGPRGGLLSGGQKQRVAIARALMRHPRLLMLDEATSALDSTSEAVVQKAIDELTTKRSSSTDGVAGVKPTTIVIAHRLSTVHNADLILVIAKGRLVEQGTHTELMEKEGVYYDLHQKGSL